MRYFQPKTVDDKKVKTQQQFANETDINYLVARYKKTGTMGGANPTNAPQYVDTTIYSQKSYEDAFNEAGEVQSLFESLPALVRARFRHNPANMLAFLDDPKNRAEGIKLGLLEPPKPKEKRPEKDENQVSRTSAPLDVTGTTDTKPENMGKKRVRKTIIEEEI